MADIFYTRDALNLLRGKKVYLIGDSNIRALYKDVVCLLVHNRLLTEKQLKEKAEKHFLGDDLLRGSPLTKGRAYKEDRRFKAYGVHVEFHFVTKCLNEDIEEMMRDFRNKKISAPDILVMNSTLWDVNRWGYNGVELFKDNMMRLMRLFKASLPPSTLVIWVTAPPLSVEIRGGFMIKQIEFAKFTMRFHVMEANMYAQQLLSQNGYNVLDYHFHLRWQVHWRNPDGLHWTNKTMRHLTNLLLTHISLALKVPLPGNLHSLLLEKHKQMVRSDLTTDFTADVDLPDLPLSLQLPDPEPRDDPDPDHDDASEDGVVFARPRAPRPPPRQAVRRGRGQGQGRGGQGGQGYSRNHQPRYDEDPYAGRRQQHQQQHQQPRQRQHAPPPPPRSARWNGPSSYSQSGSGRQSQSSQSHASGSGYHNDYSADGPYFEYSSAPQQIQSLWGPVQRKSRHGDRRHRPY